MFGSTCGDSLSVLNGEVWETVSLLLPPAQANNQAKKVHVALNINYSRTNTCIGGSESKPFLRRESQRQFHQQAQKSV